MINERTESLVDKIIDGKVGEGLMEGLDYRRRKDNISQGT